jgi:hypothetical protein
VHKTSPRAPSRLPALRLSWSPEHRGYYRGTTPCLSCLLAAGRYRELLDLIDTAPSLWWHYRRYGVQALAVQGRTDEAIRYAEQSLGLNDGPSDMARTCEEILLAAGRGEEAYRRFAYTANRAGSHLATFRAIKKKYSDKAPWAILDDLIAQTPGEEGKWFATAKTLGLLDLALDLVRGSPVDIGTLLRAARDLQESNPRFALQAAVAALRWMAAGRFYELRAGDVWDACRFALETAEVTGQAETIQAFLDELTAALTRTPSFASSWRRPTACAALPLAPDYGILEAC